MTSKYQNISVVILFLHLSSCGFVTEQQTASSSVSPILDAVVTIATSPSATSNNSKGTFTFSSTSSSSLTFECQIDSGSYSACTSPLVTANLSDGTHTFKVRAVAGNSVSAATEKSWIIDSTLGQFAFFANCGNNSISAFSINPTSGVLTAVSGSPFAAGQCPTILSKHPTSPFLYAVNYTDKTVSGYRVSSAGVLTALPNSPYNLDAAGGGGQSIVVHPSGKFLYTNQEGVNTLLGFSIDAATGALTSLGAATSVAVGSYESTITPNGKFLYVGVNAGVAAYSISETTGLLSAVAGSPFTTGGTLPWALLANADSTRLYEATNGQNLHGFSINASSGALTPLAGSPLTTTERMNAGAIDSTQSFLYMSGLNTSTILPYAINSTTGGLTALAPVASAPDTTVSFFAPKSEFLYAAGVTGTTLVGYRKNSDGTLTPITMSVTIGSDSYGGIGFQVLD